MSGRGLVGINVVLRPPEAADAVARQALGSDPEIHRMFGGSQSDLVPHSAQQATGWLKGLQEHPYAWIIEVGRRMIGEIRLDRLDMGDRRATLAIGIFDPEALGRGYGTEAIQLLLGHAFGEIGLHRVSLRVLAYNERAIRCYEKCGFIVEGRERESARVDGEWHDDVMMGVLASDYLGRST